MKLGAPLPQATKQGLTAGALAALVPYKSSAAEDVEYELPAEHLEALRWERNADRSNTTEAKPKKRKTFSRVIDKSCQTNSRGKTKK